MLWKCIARRTFQSLSACIWFFCDNFVTSCSVGHTVHKICMIVKDLWHCISWAPWTGRCLKIQNTDCIKMDLALSRQESAVPSAVCELSPGIWRQACSYFKGPVQALLLFSDFCKYCTSSANYSIISEPQEKEKKRKRKRDDLNMYCVLECYRKNTAIFWASFVHLVPAVSTLRSTGGFFSICTAWNTLLALRAISYRALAVNSFGLCEDKKGKKKGTLKTLTMMNENSFNSTKQKFSASP